MPDDRMTHTTIRLPAVLSRAGRRGAPWQVRLGSDDGEGFSPFHAEAGTPADARQALSDLVTGALHRWRRGVVLVIGGDTQYAEHLHVINPEPGGWVVYAVRFARVVGSWHSDHDRDALLRHVLDHVGGDPAVVEL